MKRSGLMLLVAFGFSGCANHHQKPIPDDPFYAPVYPETPVTRVAPTGSIYLDSQSTSLYTDLRAHKVGDIITVVLTESTKAKKSAGNQIKKATDLNIKPVYLGGNNLSIKGNPLDARYSDSMDTNRESDADQSNSLSGNISANVMQVLANGNLVIRGEKWITINNGDEFIRVTGIIRPQDITPENTIDSPRVANARIQYSGTGAFADAQKVGWLSAFFLGEWWPF